jgi:hypothetical protein
MAACPIIQGAEKKVWRSHGCIAASRGARFPLLHRICQTPPQLAAMSRKRRPQVRGRKAKSLTGGGLSPQSPNAALDESGLSSSSLKRSAAITLLLVGTGGLAVYAAAGSSCRADDWNQSQDCRSRSGSIHFSGSASSDQSSVERRGFGKTGAAHNAGG